MNLTRRAALLGSAAICTGMSPAQRAVILGGGLPGTGPSLSLDFTTGALDPSITFTRASSGWYFDATGTLRATTANLPRFDYGPTPGGVTNWLRNNSMIGAVAGTPGTSPTNWFGTWPAGITQQIVSLPTVGGMPGIRFSLTGTPGGGGSVYQFDSVSAIPVVSGQTWTGSLYAQLNAGSFTTGIASFDVAFREYDASQTFLRQTLTTLTGITSTLTRVSSTITTGAGTAFIVLSIRVTGLATIPSVVDFTIAGVQVEQAASAGAVVLTTNAAANVGAIPLGLLIEEQRTNGLRNSSMTGAVIGTPGTIPTNWQQSNTSGLLANVVATGTDHGIPYVDFRINGTTAGSTDTNIVFEVVGSIAAVQNQTWSSSVHVALIGGSLANVSAIKNIIQPLDAGAGSLTIGSSTIAVTAGPLASQRSLLTYTLPDAITAWVRNFVKVTFAAPPVAVDITIRIGAPQLELGAFATSPILTTAAAVTRAADNASMPASSWFNTAGHSALCVCMEPAINPAINVPWEFDDGAVARDMVFLSNTGAALFVSPSFNIGLSGPVAANATLRLAGAFGSVRSAGSINGNAITSGAPALPAGLTTLRFGGTPSGTQKFSGYIQQFKAWRRVLSDTELQAATAVTPTVGTATGFSTAGGTLAFTGAHDATGASYLIAAIGISSPAAYTPIATYNGVTMTLLGTRNDGAGAMWVWGLRNPIAGSNTLSISAAGFAGSAGVIAFNVAGTSSTPIGAVATGILPAVAGGGPGTVTITQTRASSLIIGIATQSFDPPAATPSGSPAPTPIITQLSADTHGSAAAAYQAGGPIGTVIGTTWTPVWNPMYLATIEVLPA